MRRLLILLAFCAATAAHAADPWDVTDKALAATAMTSLAIDWRQTQTIAENPNRWYELNPILGHHPSIGAVNRHFAFNAVLIGTIANYLPSKYRKVYLGAVSVVELSFAKHNYGLGIRFAL